MWQANMSTSSLLLSVATALMLLSTTIILLPDHAAATPGGSGDNNGAQDTMYDLEGSTDDVNQGSGDTSDGSGSGSGEPPISDCRVPPSGTYPEPTDFEDQLLPEIRCHLACIELVSLYI